jgi:predicted metal-dependent phosphoesterase TrpH
MYTIDLHAHTRFFHAFPGRPTAFDPVGARLLALVARYEGLDAVALTNHDYYRRFDPGVPGVEFLPGVEITTTDGHVLVVGPDPPAGAAPGELTPGEAVEKAHERDCIAVVAHPFRRGTVRDSTAPFDAVEINGKHPDDADRVRELADRLGLPIVGGSDAHYPFEAGRAATLVQADRLTAASVVEAVRDGRVEPVVRDGMLDQLLRRGYHHVHRYRH